MKLPSDRYIYLFTHLGFFFVLFGGIYFCFGLETFNIYILSKISYSADKYTTSDKSQQWSLPPVTKHDKFMHNCDYRITKYKNFQNN